MAASVVSNDAYVRAIVLEYLSAIIIGNVEI